MSFNIGSQNAGLINNVQGDQTVRGGQHVAISSPAEAVAAMRQIRAEIESTALPSKTKAEARKLADQIERQLEQPQPDKRTAGERLARLTSVLVSAGALATAGTSLLTGLTTLAAWLGPFGLSALELLGRSASKHS